MDYTALIVSVYRHSMICLGFGFGLVFWLIATVIVWGNRR